jgi:4-carboxymuconolactone decarboxylase
MRVPPIPPAELTSEQRPLYDDMRAGIEKGFRGFVTQRADGALLGPWNPWLHHPKIGRAVWELTKALSQTSTLPDTCRQIAILVAGARFHAGYEIYAHVAMAQHDGLSDETIATIVAGERPADLPREQAVAYDTAAALAGGGTLPELSYRLAEKTFGRDGVAELIYLVGFYCMVCVTLTGFDVRQPEEGEDQGA